MKSKQAKTTTKVVDYRVISFVLFTVAFFAIFAVRPSVSLIFSLQKEKAEYEKIDRVLEQKIQQIIVTQSQFMELINNKKYVEEALPNQHHIEKTKEFLLLQSEVTEFSIQKIKIIPPEKPELNKVVFNVNAAGSFQDFNALLDYINNSRRLITIDFLNVSRESSASPSGNLNYRTILNTYYYL